MPRRLKDTQLDNRTARLRLKPRAEPYWRRISRTCHLGYRRNRTLGGKWVARRYDGSRYSKRTLGLADDELEADGLTVFDFTQAQELARQWFGDQAARAQGIDPGPYSIGRCLGEYLSWFKDRRKGLAVVSSTINTHIRPRFGDLDMSALTTEMIRKWHQELATTPKQLRTADGMPVNRGKLETSEDRRKRKDTANRVLLVFRAALNHAYNEDRVDSNSAWSRVKPFKNVESARINYLERQNAVRLVNSCPDDFKSLVKAALLTGCRYGELTRLRVDQYKRDAGALRIEDSKGARPRTVFLTDEGLTFFEELTGGRPPEDGMFLRADEMPWKKSHQTRRMKSACDTAGIRPAVSFHILRHTYASHYLMNGGSLPGLAAQLGHADTRMTTRHYGHLAESWRAEEARDSALTLETASTAVVPISRRSKG